MKISKEASVVALAVRMTAAEGLHRSKGDTERIVQRLINRINKRNRRRINKFVDQVRTAVKKDWID